MATKHQKEAAAFVLMLMHARTNAHMLHLQTRSFAQHMALDELYKGLPDLIDAFVENFQGVYGVIDEYPADYTPPKSDPIVEIGYLARSIKRERESLPQDSQLQNIVDEIATLVDTTNYKLKTFTK